MTIIPNLDNMIPQGLHGTLPTSRDTPTLLVQHLVPLGFKITCGHDGLQDPLEDSSVGQLPCAPTRASSGQCGLARRPSLAKWAQKYSQIEYFQFHGKEKVKMAKCHGMLKAFSYGLDNPRKSFITNSSFTSNLS